MILNFSFLMLSLRNVEFRCALHRIPKKMNKKVILALIFFFFLSKSDLDFHKNDEIDSQLREQ